MITKQSRRDFVKTVGLSTAAVALGANRVFANDSSSRKRHLVTLSFDDGFRKSFIRTAEIFEKFGLTACLNVMAAGFPNDKDGYVQDKTLGDFELWNELKQRGHEIMPHGHQHENLTKIPLEEAQDLVRRCLDIFTEKLDGFDAKRCVFNFPYNMSTPELEAWLPSQVRAFRTGGTAISPFPSTGQTKVVCSSHGPDNAEASIDGYIERLLKLESGWLVFNTHGLDDEGWGPIRASYLEFLLERLLAIESVEIISTGRALEKYADRPV